LPTDPTQLALVADGLDDRPALWTAFGTAARGTVEATNPEHARLCAAAETAQRAHDDARRALAEARRRQDERLAPIGPIAWAPDLPSRLADLQRNLAATHQQLTDARARITRLTAEPALLTQPPGQLAREHDAWRARHDVGRRTARTTAPGPQPEPNPTIRPPRPEDLSYLDPQRTPNRSIPR
jgi:exodeoxyribonuclease V alpha subunit